MSLDMYFIKVKKDKALDDAVEVGSFRKHSDLHGYIEDLYIKSGGTEEFNCIPFQLSKEEIVKIRELSKLEMAHGGVFNQASGFFWGESQKEDWKKTAELMDKILEETDFEKEEIYYDSWW